MQNACAFCWFFFSYACICIRIWVNVCGKYARFSNIRCELANVALRSAHTAASIYKIDVRRAHTLRTTTIVGRAMGGSDSSLTKFKTLLTISYMRIGTLMA